MPGPAIPAGTREKSFTQRQRKMLAFIREFTARHSPRPAYGKSPGPAASAALR
jgi:hypothetical protein